ncbi:nicotinate-nucleotide adenylyltransferase [Geoalkalibacter halelectricus]|uniref:Nicotinate-nucleotide adenylyltransferase n=1 Tax=Geoalkalibacter halelectricus TaxID=2847045 RepID=A0ABY5ZUK8_9BACT|nr:nicotinate-nucleotide adenylyltransferase [Geoalkalibacter halelectricus]MDO3379141.1 nicotinate-nucleotide adenylyltransferase [Geoalkalibacter halelectricus]UWZ80901.1 nicotinate-nucleotide adenylyltransferase [Geoalkalibacter halelectricus]
MLDCSEMGVIHGRFQVLHRDHLRYLLAGAERSRHLVVGITNPDPSLTRAEEADTRRDRPLANPLSYFERYLMVRAVLEEAGIQPGDFSVVPLPINLPELYRHYVPLDALYFLSIYDDWGRKKLARFQNMGLRTHVLWEVPPEDKGLSAGAIRDLMAHGQPWEHLVPPAAARLLNHWDIPARLAAASRQDGTPG